MKYANIILNNQMAMEDLICKEDMRATSLILAIVGVPSNDPKKRVFFEDVDSCTRFTSIYLALAGLDCAGLSLDNVTEVMDYLKTNPKACRSSGIRDIHFEECEDDGYAKYPQFHSISKSKRKSSEYEQLSFLIG